MQQIILTYGVIYMEIRYSKSALKFLAKLEKKSAMRIVNAIQSIPAGDIKVMQGYDDGRMRLRVGNWRVIYRMDHEGALEIIFVIDIGNRGDIYK